MNKNNGLVIKVVVAATYLTMVTVNALANAIPINGVTTGGVSDSFPDLFAPAPITFSIWGLIYILLAGYTLYQFGLFQADHGAAREELFKKIGILFAISSVANTLWIFAWHYNAIWLSLLFMIVILICLILIANRLSEENFSTKEKGFIRLPFSIYFGWITVATIANVTTFLVSLGWGGSLGPSDQIWMVIILLVGAAIGIARMRRDNDIAYGLVILWAYAGILNKHISPAGFVGQYSAVIIFAIISIIILVLAKVLLFYPGFKKA